MKIFSAAQIRAADAYTIEREPVESIGLMERAARQCTKWIIEHIPSSRPVYLFCGMGNNGGDGLAVARLLCEEGYNVQAHIIFYTDHFSADCLVNKNRLEHVYGSPLQAVHTAAGFPSLPEDAVVIDALFGTGLKRPLQGLAAEAVEWMNRQGHMIISIDLPSGMYADRSSLNQPVVKADYTLSFEFFKLAFLLPENAPFVGEVLVLPIGLHPGYIDQTLTPYHIVDTAFIQTIYKRRRPFSHKGTYGHALLVAGSFGKMGAALLAARACLRSGVGLLSCHIPACGYLPMQTAVPEAMCLCDQHEQHLTAIPFEEGKYHSVGIGPGIGQHPDTVQALERFLDQCKTPLVLDADALNILGRHPRLLEKIPRHSILSPHPKEFERLFGESGDDFERLKLLGEKCRQYSLYILLKGHYSCTATPDGRFFFNPTGNAGMATGGSGDVLTGILTGLLAAQYEPLHAALLGAFLHGRAGDLAAAALSQESMLASDITENLGAAFKSL